MESIRWPETAVECLLVTLRGSKRDALAPSVVGDSQVWSGRNALARIAELMARERDWVLSWAREPGISPEVVLRTEIG
jgi:hypothetical protein